MSKKSKNLIKFLFLIVVFAVVIKLSINAYSNRTLTTTAPEHILVAEWFEVSAPDGFTLTADDHEPFGFSVVGFGVEELVDSAKCARPWIMYRGAEYHCTMPQFVHADAEIKTFLGSEANFHVKGVDGGDITITEDISKNVYVMILLYVVAGGIICIITVVAHRFGNIHG